MTEFCLYGIIRMLINKNSMHGGKKMKSRKLTIGLFILYLLALVWIVLFKLNFSLFGGLDYLRSINLVPFAGTRLGNGVIDMREIVDNVLVFIPYGIFVCMLMVKKNFAVKVIPVFLTSLAIELLQYIFAIGATDITDLLTNTAGGMIGIGIYFVFFKIFKDKTNKIINTILLIGAIAMVLLIGLILIANS